MNTQAIKQFRALTGASLVVSVNLIRDLTRVDSYDSVDDLVHVAGELYRDLDYPSNLTEYETALACFVASNIAEMERCEQNYFADTMKTASYRAVDGTIVQCSLAELAERLDRPVEDCPTFWDFSDTAPAPVQKLVKKQSVVCSIAAKLAKAGIKNPMQAAWKLHKAIMTLLDCIKTGNEHLFLYLKGQVFATLGKHDLLLVELIPIQTATIICFH